MSRRLFCQLVLSLTTLAAFAQSEGSLWWGFHHGTDVPDSYLGVSKATTYEAAIHVDGTVAPLQGSVVKAVRLPFKDVTHISGVTLWLAASLDGEHLAEVSVASPAAGWNAVTLPEPVAIPEDGLFVGYTFTVTDLDGLSERPLVMCYDYSDGGLYLRVTDVAAYADWYNSKRYGSLAMQLELSGPSLPYSAVAVEAIQSANMVKQTDSQLQVMLTNYGTAAVNALRYTYVIGEETRTGSYEMSEPLPAVYGAQTTVTVPVVAPSLTGRLTASLTLDAVNGISNTQEQRQTTTQLLCLQYKPHRRTVMEEYTGTWCSMCPRGFAGIARLKLLYPDDFIAVSVHVLNGDPMDVYYDYYYVINTTQFPSCRFDRGAVTDPYDGDIPDGHFHADQNFKAANNVLAAADMTVKAEWQGDDVCDISTTVDFAYDAETCDYMLAYVMTEDGLRGPEGDHAWHQKNSFPQLTYYVEDDMQRYVNATGSMIDDIAYNDVVIAMSDVRGIEGSLEGSQQVGVTKTHHWQLTRSAVSQNKDNIHVVALLIDKDTKRIANAAIAKVTQPAGIRTIDNSPLRIDNYYNLQGKRLATPERGLNIVRQADGSTQKVLIK